MTHSPEGWWLDEDEHGVTARREHRAVAHVEVADEGATVQLVFWLDEGLPRQLGTALARRAFARPALGTRRPVAVALPHRETDLLQEVRAHVAEAHTHVAGTTCLVDGRMR